MAGPEVFGNDTLADMPRPADDSPKNLENNESIVSPRSFFLASLTAAAMPSLVAPAEMCVAIAGSPISISILADEVVPSERSCVSIETG